MATKECELCKGTGRYPVSYRAGVRHRRLGPCPICQGARAVYKSNGRPAWKEH